tara:strand:+ start:347 stop:805 length:459 start_codon:yes stop_codon:yes gene_type:complete
MFNIKDRIISWARDKMESVFREKNMQYDITDTQDGEFTVTSSEIRVKHSQPEKFDDVEEMMDFVGEDMIEYGEDTLEIGTDGSVPPIPTDFADRVLEWIDDVKFDPSTSNQWSNKTKEEYRKIMAMTPDQQYRAKQAIVRRIWIARWNNLNK